MQKLIEVISQFQTSLAKEFTWIKSDEEFSLGSMNKTQKWDQRFIDAKTFPKGVHVDEAIQEGRFSDASLEDGYAKNAVKAAWNTATRLKELVDKYSKIDTVFGNLFFAITLRLSMNFISANLGILGGDDQIPRVVDERTLKLAKLIITTYQNLLNTLEEFEKDSKLVFLLNRLGTSPELIRDNLQKAIHSLNARIEKYTAQHSQEYVKKLDDISKESGKSREILSKIYAIHWGWGNKELRYFDLSTVKELLRAINEEATNRTLRNKLSALKEEAEKMEDRPVVYRRDNDWKEKYLTSTPGTSVSENSFLRRIVNLKAKTLETISNSQKEFELFFEPTNFAAKTQKLHVALYKFEVEANLIRELNTIFLTTKNKLDTPKLPDKLSLASEDGTPAELTSGVGSLETNIALLRHNLNSVFPRQIESVDQKLALINETQERLAQILQQVKDGKVPIEFNDVITPETLSVNKVDIVKLIESYLSKLIEEKQKYEKLKSDYLGQQHEYEEKLLQFEIEFKWAPLIEGSQDQTRVADSLNEEIKRINASIDSLKQQDLLGIRKISRELDVIEKLPTYQAILRNEQFATFVENIIACRKNLLNKEIEFIEMRIKGFEKYDDIKNARATIINQIQELRNTLPNYKDRLKITDYENLLSRLNHCEKLLGITTIKLLGEEIKSIKDQINHLKQIVDLVSLSENKQALFQDIARITHTLSVLRPIIHEKIYSELLNELSIVKARLEQKPEELKTPSFKGTYPTLFTEADKIKETATLKATLDKDKNTFIEKTHANLGAYLLERSTPSLLRDLSSSAAGFLFGIVESEQTRRDNYINKELIPALDAYKKGETDSSEKLQKTLEKGYNNFTPRTADKKDPEYQKSLHYQLDNIKSWVDKHEGEEKKLDVQSEIKVSQSFVPP